MEEENFGQKHPKAKKSLRTLLVIWFLVLSIGPISFMTWYSLNKFEQALNIELQDKSEFNRRELLSWFKNNLAFLKKVSVSYLKDSSLHYYLKRGDTEALVDLSKLWLTKNSISQISLFDPQAQFLFSTYRSKYDSISVNINEGENPVAMSDEFLKRLGQEREIFFIDVNSKHHLNFTSFSKIISRQGELVGYIKSVKSVSILELKKLANALSNSLVAISKPNTEKKFVSHQRLYDFQYDINMGEEKEFIIKNEPFSFKRFKVSFGSDWVYVDLGVSRRNYERFSTNILNSFMSVMGILVVILALMSFLITVTLLKPVAVLVETIRTRNPGDELIQLPIRSSTELGLLTKYFNKMFAKVHNSQNELKENINNLEDVNTEIKDSQSKLVHSEKMASLGRLVAGVAHELNNPIGFIYSNIGHLREYSNSLVKIISDASDKENIKKSDLDELKNDNDYNFIVKDLPKLIQSCEDGARRTRDIVLGLRNFSRIDESVLKEVSITEGIDRTLDLLKSELKSKITVVKKYGKTPPITCYPSQLNQVFMNILANAIQSIEERGEIEIQTKIINNDSVGISIKDSGVGMDEETVSKIFDPFFTTKDVGKGTGLGLSISYGIIQKHSGKIEVSSKVGEGTKFLIVLPISGVKNIESA